MGLDDTRFIRFFMGGYYLRGLRRLRLCVLYILAFVLVCMILGEVGRNCIITFAGLYEWHAYAISMLCLGRKGKRRKKLSL